MILRNVWTITWACLALTTAAQDGDAYRKPPKVMEELLLAPPTPGVSIGQEGRWMLVTERSSYPSLAELAEPEVRVGGLRMNPANFSPSRSAGVVRMRLHSLRDRKDLTIAGLPSPLRAVSIQWSPDESRFAFVNLSSKRADLYLVDIATATARKVNKAALNTLPGNAYAWVGNDRLLYRTVPAGTGPMPDRNPVPRGPVIQQNLGRQGASRTYQDLIRTPYDEELFAWLTTSQLVIGGGGTEKPLGRPAIIAGMAVSPDKGFVLLTTLQRPFSYLIPASGFPKRISVLSLSDGRSWTLAETPSE